MSITHLYASSTFMFICFMMYAMATVGDREIPAKQWTMTHPLSDLTFSVGDRANIICQSYEFYIHISWAS